MGKHYRYKWILFDEPKPSREYMEFWRAADPDALARERGYTVNKKLKKMYKMMFLNALVMMFYLSAFLSVTL